MECYNMKLRLHQVPLHNTLCDDLPRICGDTQLLQLDFGSVYDFSPSLQLQAVVMMWQDVWL